MTDKVKSSIIKALDREYQSIEKVKNDQLYFFLINGKERIRWFTLHDRIRGQILLLVGSTYKNPDIAKLIYDYVNAKVKQPKKNIQESLPDKLIKRFDLQLNDLEHMWGDTYELNGGRLNSDGIEYHLADYCINYLGLKYTPELESLINDYVTDRLKPIQESVDDILSDKVKDRFVKIFDREVKAEPLDLYSFKGKYHNIRGLIITLSDYIIDRLGSENDTVDIVIKFIRDYISTIKPWASDLNEEINNFNKLEQYIYKKLIKKYKFTIGVSNYSKNGWLLICAEKNSNIRWITNTVIRNMEEEYGLPPKLIDKVLFNIEKTVYERLNNAKGFGKFYVDLDVDAHGLSIIGEGLLEKNDEEKKKLISYLDKKYPDDYDEHKLISRILLKLVDIYGWAENRGSTGIQLDQKEWDARKKFVINYVNNRNRNNIVEDTSDEKINNFAKKMADKFIFDCKKYKKYELVGFKYGDKNYHNGEIWHYINERIINDRKTDLTYDKFWDIIKEKYKECLDKNLNEQSYLKSKNIDGKLLDLLNKKFANKITLKNWKLIFTEAMDFLYDRIGKENQNRKDYIDMNEFVSKFIYGELESKFGPEWHKLRHI